MTTLTIHLERAAAGSAGCCQVRYHSDAAGFHPPPFRIDAVPDPAWQTMLHHEPTTNRLAEAGRAMSAILFPPGGRSMVDALRQSDEVLYLRLLIEDTGWQAAPWEALWDWHRDAHFALHWQTPVVRLTHSRLPTRKVTLDAPLRMVLAVASPQDLPDLGADAVIAHHQEALAPLVSDGRVALRTVFPATQDSLNQAVLQHRPHVIHLIAHGAVINGKSVLALENSRRRQDRIMPQALNSHINHPQAALVILGVCESADSEAAAFQWQQSYGIAGHLLRSEIPYVVGMQGAVDNVVAAVFERKFFEAFYGEEASGSFEAAMTHARRFVASHQFARPSHWLQPVLFCQGPVRFRKPAASEQHLQDGPTGAKYTTHVHNATGPIHIGDRAGADEQEN